MVSPDRISYLFWIIYFFREHTKVCLIFIEGRIMNTRRLQLAADNERRQTPASPKTATTNTTKTKQKSMS
jgi:hypothetical protein